MKEVKSRNLLDAYGGEDGREIEEIVVVEILS